VFLPVRIRKIGGKILRRRDLKKLYRNDFKRFSESAIGLVSNMDAINLRSRITIGYHGIEKGFCKPNFRFGFVSSVPGRIVTFSTKTGLLDHWKRDLTI
jgi:hypothetical protein